MSEKQPTISPNTAEKSDFLQKFPGRKLISAMLLPTAVAVGGCTTTSKKAQMMAIEAPSSHRTTLDLPNYAEDKEGTQESMDQLAALVNYSKDAIANSPQNNQIINILNFILGLRNKLNPELKTAFEKFPELEYSGNSRENGDRVLRLFHQYGFFLNTEFLERGGMPLIKILEQQTLSKNNILTLSKLYSPQELAAEGDLTIYLLDDPDFRASAVHSSGFVYVNQATEEDRQSGNVILGELGIRPIATDENLNNNLVHEFSHKFFMQRYRAIENKIPWEKLTTASPNIRIKTKDQADEFVAHTGNLLNDERTTLGMIGDIFNMFTKTKPVLVSELKNFFCQGDFLKISLAILSIEDLIDKNGKISAKDIQENFEKMIGAQKEYESSKKDLSQNQNKLYREYVKQNAIFIDTFTKHVDYKYLLYLYRNVVHANHDYLYTDEFLISLIENILKEKKVDVWEIFDQFDEEISQASEKYIQAKAIDVNKPHEVLDMETYNFIQIRYIKKIFSLLSPADLIRIQQTFLKEAKSILAQLDEYKKSLEPQKPAVQSNPDSIKPQPQSQPAPEIKIPGAPSRFELPRGTRLADYRGDFRKQFHQAAGRHLKKA